MLDNYLIFNGIKYNLVETEETSEETSEETKSDKDFQTNTFNLSNLSLQRLNGVHPRLVQTIKEAIINSPFDFVILQGFRTAEEQYKLFLQGRKTAGKKVTNCDGYKNKSNHQAKSDGFGYAIDFGIYDKNCNGNVDWNSINKYKAVAQHIMNVGAKNGLVIGWGGNWNNTKDYPHIELLGVK